jgi:hypothetical protein
MFHILLKLFSPPSVYLKFISEALDCSLSGCETMQNGGKLPTPQRNTLPSSSRFKSAVLLFTAMRTSNVIHL